jgi:hypothetical protein
VTPTDYVQILGHDQTDVEGCREALEVALARRDDHIWEAIDVGHMSQNGVAETTGLSRGAVKKVLTRPRTARSLDA